jgi:hypothetical protein
MEYPCVCSVGSRPSCLTLALLLLFCRMQLEIPRTKSSQACASPTDIDSGSSEVITAG